MILKSDRLPAFVFVAADGSATHLRLAERCGRIAAIAARIRVARPDGGVVGLMFPSGADLVLAWLGCVLAGAEPLVMQYPTRRQTRQYWESSVAHTVALAGVALVLCDAASEAAGLGGLVALLTQAELDGLADLPDAAFGLDDFAIIQLSSGTTGHRKAMRLSGAALQRHASDFNQVLGLSAADRIVSWLPLYHDMGYVACFVMPLLLGVDVVMMDPVTWVQSPGLLYRAIEEHGGTVCYMPNFGFEVMAREAPRALPGMRLWISCSEPVSPATLRRFASHVGAGEHQLAACYAMAENVFAVSFATGIATRQIDHAEVISCGAPIAGVDLRLLDGEIWVRSPASIHAYVGGEDIRDSDGFYPTGDLGEMHDGALYVTGRRQDLLIQAGRKFMLSDIDLALNRLFPEIRGRAAALARFDVRLGTQMPIVLIESEDFYTRTDQDAIAAALCAATALDQVDVAFVPPRFLTKTSSGKISRKLSAAHWEAVLRQRAGNGVQVADRLGEIVASFPRVARDAPLREALDSLSLTVLRVILGDAGAGLDTGLTLGEIESRLAAAAPVDGGDAQAGIRIVSLAERRTLSRITERHLAALSRRLGCPVSLEHVCLPPTPIILSDLVFCDYFLPRVDAAPYASVQAVLAKLRGASVILVDDAAELRLPPNQAYGVLSHDLARDPRTDLIAVRWQSYARQHHRLPLTFVAGRDLPLDESTQAVARLSAYLDCPVFRIASHGGLAPFTQGWDFRYFEEPFGGSGAGGQISPSVLLDALADWLGKLASPPRRLPTATTVRGGDLGHFCSHFAHRKAIDVLLRGYGSFCIAGQTASIPYIAKALEKAGKPFVIVPSFAPEILTTVDFSYECLLICGAWGDFPITTPAAAIMFVAQGRATFNIADPRLARLRFKRRSLHDPESATDWFHPGTLHRDWPTDVWARERASGARPTGDGGDGSADAELSREVVRGGTSKVLAAHSRAARTAGDLARARASAQMLIQAEPDNITGYRLLALAAFDDRDFALAEQVCARAEVQLGALDAGLIAMRKRLQRARLGGIGERG